MKLQHRAPLAFLAQAFAALADESYGFAGRPHFATGRQTHSSRLADSGALDHVI